MIATNSSKLEISNNNVDSRNIGPAHPKPREKRSLKFSKLWKMSGGESDQPRKSSSLVSTFKSLSLKRCNNIPRCQVSQTDNLQTPKQERRLGTSIVLLSPNDAEMIEKLDTKPPQSQQEHRLPANSVTSTRNNLIPIIKNPRQRFLDSDRQQISQPSKIVQPGKNSKPRMSAHNKVTLV